MQIQQGQSLINKKNVQAQTKAIQLSVTNCCVGIVGQIRMRCAAMTENDLIGNNRRVPSTSCHSAPLTLRGVTTSAWLSRKDAALWDPAGASAVS